MMQLLSQIATLPHQNHVLPSLQTSFLIRRPITLPTRLQTAVAEWKVDVSWTSTFQSATAVCPSISDLGTLVTPVPDSTVLGDSADGSLWSKPKLSSKIVQLVNLFRHSLQNFGSVA